MSAVMWFGCFLPPYGGNGDGVRNRCDEERERCGQVEETDRQKGHYAESKESEDEAPDQHLAPYLPNVGAMDGPYGDAGH